jgi:hypothetical protein
MLSNERSNTAELTFPISPFKLDGGGTVVMGIG